MRTKLPLLVVLGMTLISLHSLHGQSFLTNGLVAYYPFSGDVMDKTGRGNGGRIVGSVNFSSDRFESLFSAINFNGNSASVSVSNTLINIGWPQYSFSGWFFTTNINKESQTILNTSPHNGISLAFNYPRSGGRFVSLWIGDSVGWLKVNTHGSKSNWEEKRWYHFCVTKSNNLFQTYIDGSLENTTNVVLDPTLNVNSGLSFGNTVYGNENFSGSLDDIRVYNRTLSSDEVNALYYYESRKSVTVVKSYTLDFDGLFVGTNYQLQVSTNVVNWSNWGSPFTATSGKYTNAVPHQRVDEWSKLFFRLVPQ